MPEDEWLLGKTDWKKECYERIIKVHKILGRKFKVGIEPYTSPSLIILEYPENNSYTIPSDSIPAIQLNYGEIKFANSDDKHPAWAVLSNYSPSLRCYNIPLSDKQKAELGELVTLIEEKKLRKQPNQKS
jgi:hypothetical protein